MWFPPEEPWQYRLLDVLPRGVDPDQLAADRRLTPTERVEKLQRLNAAAKVFRDAVKAVTA